jgi:hypothetical protein
MTYNQYNDITPCLLLSRDIIASYPYESINSHNFYVRIVEAIPVGLEWNSAYMSGFIDNKLNCYPVFASDWINIIDDGMNLDLSFNISANGMILEPNDVGWVIEPRQFPINFDIMRLGSDIESDEHSAAIFIYRNNVLFHKHDLFRDRGGISLNHPGDYIFQLVAFSGNSNRSISRAIYLELI